jgi:hypothetical protein
MRRLVPLLLVLTLSACAGEEGQRAQQLLAQANAAQSQLTSVAYAGKVSFAVEGQRFGFAFSGAGVLKGPSAGDQWLELRGDGIPGVGVFEMSVVRRGSRMTLRSMGQTQEVPVPPALQGDSTAWGSLGAMDLAQCVKKVDVAEGRNFNGEPATRIAGVVDTACAFQAINKVASVGQAPPVDLDEIREHLGDARATLFVSERSQLLVGAVLTLEVSAQGQQMNFELAYRMTSANKPIRFPG